MVSINVFIKILINSYTHAVPELVSNISLVAKMNNLQINWTVRFDDMISNPAVYYSCRWRILYVLLLSVI